MTPNDPLKITNATGLPKATMNEPIASYSAAAAEQGTRINEPTTNPITPGRVNQSKESPKEQGIQSGYSSVNQMAALARAFGMNIKATLAPENNYYAYGTDFSTGNHVLGSVTKDVTQADGSVTTEYIQRGGRLNFAC